MSKNVPRVESSSPIEEPSVGFARPSGPPAWWYSAFGVVVILFLVIVSLSLFRMWLQPPANDNTNTTSSVETKQQTTPTNVPYRPSDSLTLEAYQNVEITITGEGVMAPDTARSLKLDDVLLIFNKDLVARTIKIQGKSISLAPNEVHVYKVFSKDIVTLEVTDSAGLSKAFTFIVQ